MKVGIEFDADANGRTGERFWVIVTAACEPSDPFLFSGRIDNDLQCTAAHGLSFGDPIAFDPQHVLALDRKT